MLAKAPAALFLLGLAYGFAQKPVPPAVDEVLPKDAPSQPVPFSHKLHTAQGMKCLDCHPIREPGFQAGFPRESACMGCHVSVKKESPHIQKLATAAKSRSPIAWARVYSVPEYVWFSHTTHHKEAGLECQTCHGPVQDRNVLAKEKPTNMFSCMKCHAQKAAPNGCDSCHSSQ